MVTWVTPLSNLPLILNFVRSIIKYGEECFMSLARCSSLKKKKKGKCFVIPAKVTETSDKRRAKEGGGAHQRSGLTKV